MRLFAGQRALAFLLLLTAVGAASGVEDERLVMIWSAKTWRSLHDTFRRFGGDFDGVVSAAFLEAAVSLLADDSVCIDDLATVAKNDEPFFAMVKDSLGDTLDRKSERVIRTRLKACIENEGPARSICHALETAVQSR
jgi:hypothetical protein